MTFNVEKGKVSEEKYLPGFYCAAAFKVSYTGSKQPQTKAVILLDSEEYDVYQGENFAGELCKLNSVEAKGASLEQQQ